MHHRFILTLRMCLERRRHYATKSQEFTYFFNVQTLTGNAPIEQQKAVLLMGCRPYRFM